MKKILFLKILVFTILSNIPNAIAINVTADAEVLNGLYLAETQSLNFGEFIVGASSGTIDQDGNTTGGIDIITGGNPTPGEFFVSDGTVSNNQQYTITIDSTITLQDPTLTHSITVNNVAVSGGLTQSIVNGEDTFFVNGILTVPAGQAPETYTGYYSVAVAF